MRGKSMLGKERRNEHRYYFQQPAFLKLHSDNAIEIETVTENVSAHGLLLRCDTPIALGSKVEVKLHFPNCLVLEGLGEILRVESRTTKEAFLIAVKCEREMKIAR
jgi:hypothetical protein